MAFLHFDALGVGALAAAVPDFARQIPQVPNQSRAAYIKNFVRQTGVRQRHISVTEQTASDYAYAAVAAALERAGWDAQSLDGLVFLTQTPDSNAATGNSFILHKHLGMRDDTLVFDIAQGCASFPYGLAVCAGFLQQPGIRRMAMLCGDTMWGAYADKEALLAAPTFLIHEGGTAMLLEKISDPPAAPPVEMALYSHGAGYPFLYDPWSGARHAWRRGPGILPNGELYEGGPYMDGMAITTFSTMRVVESMQQFLRHIGKTIADFDGVVLHQANMQILKAMARRLKVPPEKFPTTVETLANTNGASVTLTMVDAYAGRRGPLNLWVSAFGILSWGIVSLTLDAGVIVPHIQCADRFEEDFLQPMEARAMSSGFAGKAFLVTGASSGIGRAVAIGLSRRGPMVRFQAATGRRSPRRWPKWRGKDISPSVQTFATSPGLRPLWTGSSRGASRWTASPIARAWPGVALCATPRPKCCFAA